MNWFGRKFWAALSIILFGGIHLQGQVKSFSENPVRFLEEMESFFQASALNKKESKEFIELFTLAWNTKITEEQKQATYTVCNQMLKKRMRPYPEFKTYLTALMNFSNSGLSSKMFSDWLVCLNKLLEGKAIRYFADYLSMSESIFLNNTFYKSPTIEWRSDNPNYSLEFDSVPKVIFPSLNLKAFNPKNDSAVIYSTKGVYYPLSDKWYGTGGKVDWGKAGLERSAVYAELGKYEIVMKSAGYTADSVIFYNKNYFPKPLKGKLTEKVLSEQKGNVTYPRFSSYEKRLVIPNVGPNVDYDGGFAMRGPKFMGAGDKEANAYLVFKRDNKRFLVVGSSDFSFSKEKILSENAYVVIHLDKDSIIHPGLQFKYIIADKSISLIRVEQGLGKTPFYNSYHKIDMRFEQLNWKFEEPRLDFRMLPGNAQGEAEFESADYYKQGFYDGLQGIEETHPLIRIKDFIKKGSGTDDTLREFSGAALAGHFRLGLNAVQPLLVQLASMGFLIYEPEKDWITIKDKLFKYISNRAGKSDYDAIVFRSIIPGESNASLNLLTNDLTIRGVSQILLSDSQQVVIYPRERKVVLKKNRDFTFAGLVHAGRFDFFGKEFLFEYDKFKVNLTNVDSLRLMVTAFEPDAYGNYPLVRVKTVIENINGDLLIDHPKNKSGVKNFPQYPVFNSLKDSYVYYDKRSIQRGVYKRDKFYFHLEPFIIDSLDNFTNAGLNLKGDMVSAGIFPQFRESLTLQHDYSLGFIRPTPPDGFPAYGGKGKFTNLIKLSNEGLHGDGTLNYVTSITKSLDFIFFPDSMNTHAQTFEIKEQKAKPEFPQVSNEEVYIHWMPYKDVMQVHKKKINFQCYNKQSEFSGRLDLSSKVLTGKGLVNFATAELEAKKITFLSNKFNSDTADFRLKAIGEAGLAFSTNNVNALIDFDSRTGDFKSNGKGTIVNFPVNKYFCFMDKFKWYMDQSNIELSSSGKIKSDDKFDVQLDGSEFISVHPNQDSLRFVAPSAKYDLKKYVITAKEVRYINVADARVYPDKGEVVVEKEAVMRTLNNAKIVANTATRYHTLYNASVNIFARRKYAASGLYDYQDEMKKKQTIKFNSITVDTTFQTYGETEIKDTSKFMLSPNFSFVGRASLFANKQFLTFSGAFRIEHTCEQIDRSWIKFTSEINPDQIYIPVTNDLVDINNDKLINAITVTNDSVTRLYTAFLTKRKLRSDTEVLPADGFLFFDKGSREYRISNKEKIIERNMPGNYLSLKVSSCIAYGEGKMALATELGLVKMETVGTATHFLIPDSSEFDVMVSLDFFFDEGLLDKMATAINEGPNLSPTDFSRPVYEKGLRELLGKEQADKLIGQINLYGSFKKFPDELKKSIFLTQVRMRWNANTKSFVSYGKIGIGNINKTQVNKLVEGRLEVKKKRGGDVVTLLIEIEENNWYFFTYTRGVMQAVSSSDVFNTGISGLKPDKREKKGEKGEGTYIFNTAHPSLKTRFKNKTADATELGGDK